jgi:hypothetical protein
VTADTAAESGKRDIGNALGGGRQRATKRVNSSKAHPTLIEPVKQAA